MREIDEREEGSVQVDMKRIRGKIIGKILESKRVWEIVYVFISDIINNKEIGQ